MAIIERNKYWWAKAQAILKSIYNIKYINYIIMHAKSKISVIT